MGYAMTALEYLALLFVFLIGLISALVIVFYVIDKTQTGDAIRRNYPVIGRFRNLFTELGEFFRQYFFAMDREEMPFNRAQRNWVYTASDSKGNTVAFGSTRNLNIPGTPIFMNAVFPPLDDQYSTTAPLRIGPYCREPYDAPSIFNISGMSYGAISKPAVIALSRGAKQAGIWLNTGGRGALALSPRRGLRHCLPDRHREIWRAGCGRQPVGRKAAQDGGETAGEDVRDQAQPGRQAGQGRYPARGQDRRGSGGDSRGADGQGRDLPQTGTRK